MACLHFGQVRIVWYFTVTEIISSCAITEFFLHVWCTETQQGIFDAVLKGYIDFESEPWPLISDSAKDLIRKMLCSRPKERLSAHEVLCMFKPSSCLKLFGE